MSRLIVEAVSNEPKTEGALVPGVVSHLTLFVCVSRADDGSPVSGLKKGQFQLCQPNLIWIKGAPGAASLATVSIFKVDEIPVGTTEKKERSGFYKLALNLKLQSGKSQVFEEDAAYVFGLGVSNRDVTTKTLDKGQTVVRLVSRDQKFVPGAGKQ
jgi:hypothetical protein